MVLLDNTRLIFYHKQATSARTRFLRFHNTVCAFETLPPLAQLAEVIPNTPVVLHPTVLLQQAGQNLGIPHSDLEVDNEFHAKVEVPSGLITIYLIRFTAIDPPFDLATRLQGRFISIMDARDLATVELQLLRIAYTAIMG